MSKVNDKSLYVIYNEMFVVHSNPFESRAHAEAVARNLSKQNPKTVYFVCQLKAVTLTQNNLEVKLD